MSSRPSPWFRAVATCASLLLAAVACSQHQATGTRTNWYSACVADADCEPDAECRCGRCTVACSDPGACGGGVCGTPLAAQVQCGDADAARLCLPPCSADADCDATSACAGGACVTRPAADGCAARPEALVCAGFDGADYGNGVPETSTEGVLALVPEPRFAGLGALAASEGHAQVQYDLPPLTAGNAYWRLWVRVSPGVTVDDLHLSELEAAGEVDWRFSFAVKSGALVVATNAAGDTLPATDSAFTWDEWHCLRLELGLDEAAGTVRAFLDERLITDATGVDTLPAGGITTATAGIEWTVAAPLSVYVDQFLLSTEPVTCW